MSQETTYSEPASTAHSRNTIVWRVFLNDIQTLFGRDAIRQTGQFVHRVVQAVPVPREFFPQHANCLSENSVRYVDADYPGVRQGEDPGAESTGVQSSDVDAGVERNGEHLGALFLAPFMHDIPRLILMEASQTSTLLPVSEQVLPRRFSKAGSQGCSRQLLDGFAARCRLRFESGQQVFRHVQVNRRHHTLQS